MRRARSGCLPRTAAIYGGENPHLGGALLDSNLINEHYNRASSLSAAENFRQIVRQYERKPRGAATPYECP